MGVPGSLHICEHPNGERPLLSGPSFTAPPENSMDQSGDQGELEVTGSVQELLMVVEEETKTREKFGRPDTY